MSSEEAIIAIICIQTCMRKMEKRLIPEKKITEEQLQELKRNPQWSLALYIYMYQVVGVLTKMADKPPEERKILLSEWIEKYVYYVKSIELNLKLVGNGEPGLGINTSFSKCKVFARFFAKHYLDFFLKPSRGGLLFPYGFWGFVLGVTCETNLSPCSLVFKRYSRNARKMIEALSLTGNEDERLLAAKLARLIPVEKEEGPWHVRTPAAVDQKSSLITAAVDVESSVISAAAVDEGSSVIEASGSTAQALITGVQGLAALLPVLVNTHCGSVFILVFAILPLLGFIMAATADVFGLGNRWNLHKCGLGLVYTGFFGLAVVFVLSRFSPGVFKAKGCFQSPKPEELLPFISW